MLRLPCVRVIVLLVPSDVIEPFNAISDSEFVLIFISEAPCNVIVLLTVALFERLI